MDIGSVHDDLDVNGVTIISNEIFRNNFIIKITLVVTNYYYINK